MKRIALLTTKSGAEFKPDLGELEVKLRQCPLRNKRRLVSPSFVAKPHLPQS